MQRTLYYSLLLALVLVGCREKYLPPVNGDSRNLLIVEGVINSGTGPTNIRLSRSMRLIDSLKIRAELNAVVTVQGKDNTSFPLAPKGNGLYSADQLTLNVNQQYRLHIKTADGKEYASSYVEVKRTPPIDSVSWRRTDRGVEIFVSSHDALNKTRYYQWDYEETWEIHSVVAAEYDYIERDKKVIPIDPYQEKIVFCWKSAPSTRLLLGSTAALSNDVLKEQPLTIIPTNDERLGVRYSILVRQYALTQGAHDFLSMMKKNTEELGSIFGPLPSELKGNIQNLADPTEVVIGYVTAASIEEKRIFINANQVDNWKFVFGCQTITVPNMPDSITYYFPSFRPYAAISTPAGITHYLGITPNCADCRLRKGVNVKPSFW
jgi:hypothetical protein